MFSEYKLGQIITHFSSRLKFFRGATAWVFVSLYILYVEMLTHKVMLLGDGGVEGGTSSFFLV